MYLRDPADLARVQAAVASTALPAERVVYLQGDVCRRELSVELEGVFAAARPRMKIASWNVNSLNVRLPHLQEWLRLRAPDVVALQETKLEDAKFPEMPLLEMGYRSVFSGQKTYNGVAILSRAPIADVQLGIPGFEDEQRRAIAATVDGVRIVNLYVVNGQTVGGDKYDYKLRWIDAVHGWLSDEAKQYPELVVLGDFNIAPEDRDVHDPLRWNEDSILTSTAERAALRAPARPRPARQLPPAQRRGRALQLVGLPRRRLPPQPRPAHRPGAGERRPEGAHAPPRTSTASRGCGTAPATTRRCSSNWSHAHELGRPAQRHRHAAHAGDARGRPGRAGRRRRVRRRPDRQRAAGAPRRRARLRAPACSSPAARSPTCSR